MVLFTIKPSELLDTYYYTITHCNPSRASPKGGRACHYTAVYMFALGEISVEKAVLE